MERSWFKAREGQTLEEHSRNVAKRASEFVSSMGDTTKAVTYIAGLLHDVGKSSSAWQRYLRAKLAGLSGGRVPHARVGVLCIERLFTEINPIIKVALKSVILGHHAGLPDYSKYGGKANGETVERVENQCRYDRDVAEALQNFDYMIREISGNEGLMNVLTTAPEIDRNNYHAWTRLIESAIVDADHLDAEMAEDRDRASKRGQGYISISECLTRYNEWCMDNLKLSDTVRGKQRREIRDACIRSAESNRGIYTLCAPTGSGKTLSSLAFALNHAVRHNKKRIVYVVPFISIIEQTAKLFREIFNRKGDVQRDNVIEHHSKYEIKTEVGKDKEAVEDERWQYKNAIENWDAPIIVTTANQFWESCLSAKTKRLRKLHNLIDAVVVVDEIQALPRETVNATIGSMQCLASLAHTTFLLMTATMPDYTTYGRSSRSIYLKRLSEEDSTAIISVEEARRYFAENPPIHYEWTKPTDTFGSVAKEVVDEGTDVLVITNTRLICRTMYEEVLSQVSSKERSGVYHLSNTMCGEHISSVLDLIRDRLAENREKRANGEEVVPLRVISTSLVEAGVDIDFPVVYREYIGLDSIIQAAGRCNREGLYELGKVRVFKSLYRKTRFSESESDEMFFLTYTRPGINAMDSVLGTFGNDYDALFRDPVFITQFYDVFLGRTEVGVYSDLISDDKCRVPFRSVGDRFRLITDESVGILVHYNDEADELIAKLKDDSIESKRDILRVLRRYTVPVFPKCDYFRNLQRNGWIQQVEGFDGLWEQVRTSGLGYSDKTGLDVWGMDGGFLV